MGYDDHEVRILIQKPRGEEEEIEEGVQMYNCQECGFKTPRVEVIMMHKKSHLQGVYTALFTKPTTLKGKQSQDQIKKSPAKKPRKSMTTLPKTKTTTIDEDIELLQKGLSIFEEKPDVKVNKPQVTSKPASDSKETILKSILCEWDNDFDDENEEPMEINTQKIEEDKKQVDEKKEEPEKAIAKSTDNSCFDFSEEEESKIGATATGRKIPRVIPDTKEKSDEHQNNDAEFLELMGSTTVPKIPEVPNVLKCEQNFHDGAPLKIPDKPELPDPPTVKPTSPTKEVATKLTNPKKRFVKSFEDFAAKFLQHDLGESSSSSSTTEIKDTDSERFDNQEELKEEKLTSETVIKEKSSALDITEAENSKTPTFTDDFFSINQQHENISKVTPQDEKSVDVPSSEELKSSSSKESGNFKSTRKSPLKLIRSPLKSPERQKEVDIEALEQESAESETSPLRKKVSDVSKSKTDKSPVKSLEKHFLNKKQEVDIDVKLKDASIGPTKSPEKQPQVIPKKISESLQNSSLKRFFKFDDTKSENITLEDKCSSKGEDKSVEKRTDSKSLEVSKLKTQLMSKLGSKEDITIASPKRNISDVGINDPQASVVESALSKYNKGKYRTRIYQKSDSNSGLHVAKKRAVTSFEDFLEKKPKKEETVADVKISEEKKVETEEKPLDVETSEEEKETVVAEIFRKAETEVTKETQKEHEKLTENFETVSKQEEGKKTEETHDQEVTNEEVPMEIETEILPTTSFERNTTAQMDVSALTTLATVSELSTTLDAVSKHKPPEHELVALDKNVTIVSEKELADGQVEFANDSVAKPLTLSSFSMDFSDSNSESGSSIIKDTQILEETKTINDVSLKNSEMTTDDPNKKEEKNVVVTEKAVVKIPQQNLSNFDIEEQIPPSIVSVQNVEPQVSKSADVPPKTKFEVKEQATTSTKLLEILNDRQKKKEESKKPESNIKTKIVSISPKGLIMKTQTKKQPEQKKKINIAETVSVQKVSTKRDYEDIEDIDTFIIQKKPTAIEPEPETSPKSIKKVATKPSSGKAKILQQTIITPTGDIIQPEPLQQQSQQQQQQQLDDNVMFDINSMPIVLGDQILQPENVDSLPVVISDSSGVAKKSEKTVIIKKSNQQQPQQVKLLNKGLVKTTIGKSPTTATYVKVHPSQIKGSIKGQKFYQIGPKAVKSSPTVIPQQGKQGKFIIVPSTSTPPGGKINVEKRMTITKKLQSVTPKQAAARVQNIAPEPAGNKIMIVTNQQGQQSRVLLTPAQQKLLGYQTSNSKIKSPAVKGTLVQKTTDVILSGTTSIPVKTVVQQRQFITTSPQLVTSPLGKQQITLPKAMVTTNIRKTPVQGQRLLLQNVTSQKVATTAKPTTIIRHQQTIKKIQPVDEALLDQQVQEQLQAIKASGLKSQQVKIEQPKTPVRQPARRSYLKKQSALVDIKQTTNTSRSASTPVTVKSVKSEVSGLPPLAPISPTKKADALSQSDTAVAQVLLTPTVEDQPKVEVQQRPLNQLIIQDAQGNQTTITEGQILALPSETVDGQPSTYMLVTLDETGNLTPLNNEALMSLDPNLGLGGDLSNMVLQLDAGNATIQPQQSAVTEPVEKQSEAPPIPVITQQDNVVVEKQETTPVVENAEKQTEDVITAAEAVTDPNQQFYVADPATAQKLIESLTEGNADFASLLANAENNSILIHADGQQILINANTDNQMLLTVNTEGLSEGTNNPIFAAQPTKSQDILAAALADTDVFQQDQTQVSKVTQAQLSPNSPLYPMNVGNVLETSLTLTSPIMTPLEVPSTNNKKIADDETDILTQVPKNVDLPITITDPNISQTVAQQQVSLMANDLQSNLELPLAISDANIVVVTTELNSPSYGFSLPSLDDAVDINQKGFGSSISMPLLSEDSREGGMKTDDSNQSLEKVTSDEGKSNEAIETKDNSDDVKQMKKIRKSSSCEDSDMMTEGLCTLGGEMCSSLSEPPPDMFDLTVVSAPFMNTMKNSDDIPESSPKTSENSEDNKRNENDIYNPHSNSRSEGTVTSDTTSDLNVDENSCEIPVQPEIVTDLSSKTFDLEGSGENEASALKRDCEEELGSERKRIRAD